MSDLKQMGALQLVEILEGQIQEEEARKEAMAKEAEGVAHFSNAMRVSYEEMTPQQREFAHEAAEKMRSGWSGRPWGFSIPHEHRKPEKK